MGLVYRGEYGTAGMVELEFEAMDASMSQNIARTSFPIGGGCLWFTNTAPEKNWILAQGQTLRQADYPLLYALWGTTYGGGADSGATTFSVPDLRQRYPMGKAASGTGSTIGGKFGTISHTHFTGSGGAPGVTGAAGAVSEEAANPPTLVVNFAIRAR